MTPHISPMTQEASGRQVSPPMETRRPHIRNILVATDFSPCSDAALLYAAAMARRYDAQIYLAHVLFPAGDAVAIFPDPRHRLAEQQMGELLISGWLRGIRHQVLLGDGELWPVLERMITEHEVDLVVTGTHGRTGARKVLLGSSAEEIFRMAPCPVMTVGPGASKHVPKEAELRHILHATGFTEAAGRAAAYALSLAQEHQARLTLLHVMERGGEASANSRELVRASLKRRLEDSLPVEAAEWCEPVCMVVEGEVPQVILDCAERNEADLIVLGIRRTGNFPGHTPPDTAYKVACAAHCPVMTVRG